MASHELGHILAAWLSGATIERIDLSPIGFSQTHLSDNPHPLLVVWAGPVVGALDALLAWALVDWWDRRDPIALLKPAIQFLAGFCLIANGVYIGVGWVDRIGDTGDMLRLGTPVAVMIGFGLACTGTGLALWHMLGPKLWLKQLNTRDAYVLAIASLAIVMVGFFANGLLR